MSGKMKILCVLYEDPSQGYPKNSTDYARATIPKISHYPDGQSTPNPSNIDFMPGQLLGSVSGELGLRQFIEQRGHQFVVVSEKDGLGCAFEKELPDADVVISQPFWPAYLTPERLAKAAKLKLALTAGIGSDHVDLHEAKKRNITVAEVTYCNSVSVAEHAVMMMLALVRDYMSQHRIANEGGWNIADCIQRSYDIEGMDVGVIAAGRIGLRVLRCMKPFGVILHYYDKHRLPADIEKELSLTYHSDAASLAKACDVVSIHCPLYQETEYLFNATLIGQMQRGSYIVNTARGKICDTDAIVDALKSGQLAGYAGDVWFPQPAAADHPWRAMPNQAMTPHTSGSSLAAQTRYAAGVREILECFFDGRPIRDEYLIVQGGALAGTGASSYR